MGLADRDYARRRPPGGGGIPGVPGMGGGVPGRGWSVNTWIIVICVSVFVFDQLIGRAGGGVAVDMGQAVSKDATAAQVERAVEREEYVVPSTLPGTNAHALVDPEYVDDYSGLDRLFEKVNRFGLQSLSPQERAVWDRVVVGQRRYAFMPLLEAIGHFSTAKGFLQLEVWRLLGFQFLHGGLWHLLFNMVGLFFFGPLAERHLGGKRYLAFYLLCGIFGAIAYLLLNLLGQAATLPGLLINDVYTPLIGASAGVFGVLMASAFLAPNATVLLFFVLPIPLKVAVYGFAIIAAINLITGGGNAGGDAAHLGGAIAGAYFIRHPYLLNEFFDFFGRAKGGGARSKKKGARRTIVGGGPKDEEVDRILSKVATQGLQSLSERERKTLQRATDSQRG